MGAKLNCWEFRNCGREPGGIFSKIHGECPIPKMMKFDGVNGGNGAGRACWTATAMNQRIGSIVCRKNGRLCIDCEFYRRVQREEYPENAVEIADEIEIKHKISTS